MMNNYIDTKNFEVYSSMNIKLHTGSNYDKLKIITEPGLWKLRITTIKDKVIGIHFYNPEFSSAFYTTDNLNPYKSVYSLSTICDGSKLSHNIPYDIPCNRLSIYDNGFCFKYDNIKIHPANFHNKVVGLMFVI